MLSSKYSESKINKCQIERILNVNCIITIHNGHNQYLK